MKKIMTALTVGALIGTAVFADVDINLGFRQRGTLFFAKDGSRELFNTDIYADNGTDNFTFGLSGDLAAFDITLVSNEAVTDQIRAKKMMGSLFLGNLTLQTGINDDGLATGAYRVSSDNGNIEGVDWEWKKLGSGFAKSASTFVDNPVQPVNVHDKSYFVGGSWKQKFDNGALDAKAYYITNEQSNKTTASPTADGSGSWQSHTLSFLVNYLNDNLGQAEAVFKVGQWLNAVDGRYPTAMAFGLYAQPKIISPLILTVGGAGSVVDSKFTDWSVDLRARLQVIPKTLGITMYNSFSALTSDGESGDTKVSNAAVRGIADCSKANLKGTAIARDKLLVNNLLIRYKPNSTLNLIAVATDMIGFGTVQGEDKDYGAHIQLRFSGWAQFFATGSASVMTGVVCAIDDVANYQDIDNHHSTWNWGIPVILRVSF